jgi:hypothetical protein
MHAIEKSRIYTLEDFITVHEEHREVSEVGIEVLIKEQPSCMCMLAFVMRILHKLCS